MLKKRSFAAVFVLALSVASFPLTASAQDKAPVENKTKIVAPTDGLTLNLGSDGSNILDLPAESVGSSLFKLDLSDTGCLTGAVGRLTSGQFHLQDRIIVGDAQAGLGYQTMG